jgi:hypothetical protein
MAPTSVLYGRPPFVSTPNQMETYAIKSPKSTHMRSASCGEVDCPHHIHGFDTIVDEATDLGAQRAAYIRRECDRIGTTSSGAHLMGRRRYTQLITPNDLGVMMTTFHFPAGQRCFNEHVVPLGRPEIFLHRAGDIRGCPDGRIHRYDRPDQWVDDCAGHQERLADLQQKG